MIRMFRCHLLPLSFMLIIPILHVLFYEPLNNGDRGVYNLVTDLDKMIPFLEVFIIPYVIWYFFIFITLGYFCVKDKEIYYKTLITYVIGLFTCYLIYFLFQTTVPRPELLGDSIFIQMVAFIYSQDQAFNAFPSIHSFSSYIMLKAIGKSSMRNAVNTLVIRTTALAIIVSTLFVKQHVVLDALSAILLGEVIFKFVYNFNGERLNLWKKKPYLLSMMKKKLEI